MTRFGIKLLFALLLAGVSYASPVALDERSIDSSLFNTFKLMSQYAAAAYCSPNNDSPGTKVTCYAGNCPLVESATTKTSIEFQNSLLTDVTGFVAVDSTNKLIVVAFRGSASIRNWIANLEFDTVSTDICSGCTAHRGFWTSWTEARANVLAAVKTAIAANPTFKVVSIGHSLGGAIATFAAAELRKAGYGVSLYTFGAPRIADSTLSDYITNQGNNYRITHYNDPVPRLPSILQGYVHISPEYYINDGNLADATANNIEIYTGSRNLGGNSAWVVVDVLAHLWYLGSVSLCFPILDTSVRVM